MNLSITKLFQRDDGLDEAVSHLKRTVRKENRQVFPNDENPMDDAMHKAAVKMFLILVFSKGLVAIGIVILVYITLIPHK